MKTASRRQFLSGSLVGIAAACSLAASSWAFAGDRDGATASARAPVWTEGMAADASAPFFIHGGAYVVTNESGETVAIDLDVPEEVLQRLRDSWASNLELISNAPSKQYTLEELAQLVDDGFWSPEGLQRIIAVELPNDEGPVRVILPSDALDDDTALAPERIRNRNMLPPADLLNPDGSLRVRVWLAEDYVSGSASADDEGNSPPVIHIPGEDWAPGHPVEYPPVDSPWGPIRLL